MAGFRDLHKWPYFEYSDKNYICTYQIDNQQPRSLSLHEMVTSAHYNMGNIGRCWETIGKAISYPKVAEWVLYMEGHVVTLSVDYVDPHKKHSLAIDYARIREETTETGFSSRTETLLDLLQLSVRIG